MKTLNNKYLFTFALFAFILLFTTSCSDDDSSVPPVNELSGLTKIQEFADDSYTITAWNKTGEWHLGYTKVYFTVQDKEGNYIENAQLTAFPEMNMGTMKHSTPRAEITKVAGKKTLYETYYCFLMYSGQGDGTWYYDLDYTVGSVSGSFENVPINVKNVFRPDGTTPRRVIQSVTAIDGSGKRYVVTLVEPQNPRQGENDITAYIHERIDGNTYNPVENFKLKLDPRMPSMGNHSSPNNVDLTWDAAEKIYKGKVNFSMTGYWTLNLILQDATGETLYGNAIANEAEAKSSLYFEVEF